MQFLPFTSSFTHTYHIFPPVSHPHRQGRHERRQRDRTHAPHLLCEIQPSSAPLVSIRTCVSDRWECWDGSQALQGKCSVCLVCWLMVLVIVCVCARNLTTILCLQLFLYVLYYVFLMHQNLVWFISLIFTSQTGPVLCVGCGESWRSTVRTGRLWPAHRVLLQRHPGKTCGECV